MAECVLCHRPSGLGEAATSQREISVRDGKLRKPGYMPRLNPGELAEILDGRHSICTGRQMCRRRREGHRLFAAIARVARL